MTTPPLPNPAVLAAAAGLRLQAAYRAYLRAQNPAPATPAPGKQPPSAAPAPVRWRPKPRLRKRIPPGGIAPVPKAKQPRKHVPNALMAVDRRYMRLPTLALPGNRKV
jgi:hypothetical protein